MLAMAACKKEAPLPPQIQPSPLAPNSASPLRLLNFAYDAEITMNGRVLTSGIMSQFFDAAEGPPNFPPTPYFISDGIWRKSAGTFHPSLQGGNPVMVPDSLLRGDSVSVSVNTFRARLGAEMVHDTITTVLHKNGSAAQDVFFYLGRTDCKNCSGFEKGFLVPGYSKVSDGKPFGMNVRVFPRDVLPAADPSRFKIRIINLGSMSTGSNLTGNGGVTLTYGDGTPVSGATSNILPGNAGAYTELPYGTYYFRIRNTQGEFLSEKFFEPKGELSWDIGAPRAVNGYTNPYGGSIPNMSTRFKGVTFIQSMPIARIKTYLAGGVYTIVISPRQITPPAPSTPAASPYYTNCYELVQDIKPQNLDYSRVQVIHALPGKGTLAAIVDGMPFQNLAYGIDSGADSYKIIQNGWHEVQVKDDGGRVIHEGRFETHKGDNVSVWIYEDIDGRVTSAPVYNDMSFTRTLANVFTQTGSYMDYWATDVTFLNMVADVKEAAFVRNAVSWCTTIVPDKTGNNIILQQGRPLGKCANFFPAKTNTVDLSAYRVVDRDSIRNTPGLSKNGIALMAKTQNRNYFGVNAAALAYPPVSLTNEYTDHGVFTIAVIGRSTATAPDPAQPRLIIINHIK
ncbi:hypothetical protein EG028_01790 [Chitinophaga barathri]|uniref:DUF4397 domain-containing protein n=2 Tax=Chitinophaga barathri TaxID=1647451 RepID=A0A3N4MM17_9BACT|nr:hypothetical protein EG028_01790 [Chitinophaga barathri]